MMMCESNENTDLGTRSTPKLPSFIDPCKVTFGVPQVRDEGAAPLLNPNIRRIDVLKSEQEDRKNYLLPYSRLFPGEQVKRNYNDHFSKDKRFGLATCIDETGGRVRRAMDWMSDKAEKMPIASERLTEGRTPGQTQAPADPALGLPTVTSVRNVAELMYGLTPKNLLGLTAPNGKPLHEDESVGHLCTTLTERERIIRALIKKQLRDKKYKRGPEITAVLCDLAKGEKYISGAAAEAVYDAFEPPLDDELRELLFDVVRGENLNKESGGEENESKTINWKLLASILDPNRIQPWEKSPQHNCIDEYPCLPQIAESMGWCIYGPYFDFLFILMSSSSNKSKCFKLNICSQLALFYILNNFH
uniref:EF-hand domain-containing protein n=1 Tax=Mesocestoides corti TaxID=53468 RepID=A0A5K3EKN9_MESCO